MRRAGRALALSAAVLLGGLLAVPVVPAFAATKPVTEPATKSATQRATESGTQLAATSAAKPATMCTVTDHRLDELSGLAVSGTGYVTVDDSSDDPKHWRIFYLNSHCAVSRALHYPSRPRDTEDLALAPDGTLWVADTGDNNLDRKTVALWRLAPGAAEPVLHRYTYPDGPHDAESLLINGDGTPIIVTKDPFSAGLYVPTVPLQPGTAPLRRAGSFRIPGTSTSNPFGIPGRLVVTGGASALDGSKVALRTYADAFEFPVTGGDVIAAVTTGTPLVTALPDEPQGESVAYSADGSSLLTVSEWPGAQKPRILRYPSALPTAAQPLSAPAGSPAPTPPSRATSSPTAAAAPVQAGSGTNPVGIALAIAAAILVLAVLTLGLIRLHRRS
jgi:hypothetical protein